MGKGMQKYMKRAFIILAVAAAAIAAALSLFSYSLAGAAFSAERGTVYRIAGAVTDDYPEAVSRIGTVSHSPAPHKGTIFTVQLLLA